MWVLIRPTRAKKWSLKANKLLPKMAPSRIQSPPK